MTAEYYPLPWADKLLPLLFGLLIGLAIYYLVPSGLVVPGKGEKSYGEWIQERLSTLFIDLSAATCRIIPLISVSLGLLAAFVLTRQYSGKTVFLALLFALIGWHLPRLLINTLVRRRIKKIDAQFVDALEMMANSIKSGLSFLQVVELVSRESPAPLSQEFHLIVSQHRMGVNLNDTLENFSKRIPSEDIIMAVNAILILRDMGGNLSETFSTVATTIRERKKVEAKIKAFTAQGTAAAIILGFFPYAMMLLFLVVAPSFIMPLFKTTLGWLMLGAMCIFQVVGVVWMKKTITIDV